MTISRIIFSAILGMGLLETALAAADTHYVAQAGQIPVEPYTNDWPSAASNIQEAVDAATAGDTVLVSNGVYQTGGVTNTTILTNRVNITKAITVRSANNDPAHTIIIGAWDPDTNGPSAVRCVRMVNNSSLIGFTITNGATLATSADSSGGGILGTASAIVSNCIITGNTSHGAGGGGGGGVYNATLKKCLLTGNQTVRSGAGALSCTLYDCTISGNQAPSGGGVAGCAIVSNCTLTGNSALDFNGGGGANGSTLFNCRLIGNSALAFYGGGAIKSTLHNCTVVSNYAKANGGGAAYYSILYNCVVSGNHADSSGGGVGWLSEIYNCTVVGNRSKATGGGAYDCKTVNCIIYSNAADSSGANWASISVITNSCTTPAVAGWADNNTINDPMFVAWGSGYGTNHVAGNYRLIAVSPCLNTGTYFDWMTNALDIRSRDMDAKPRIRYGLVDMGCYEFITRGAVLMFR